MNESIVHDDEGVVFVKTTMFARVNANQNEMIEDIRTFGLDGFVVASCSPKLHLNTFISVVERAGLNKYNYSHANIREQASWAHSDNKVGATEKAILIVKASIVKVRYSFPLEPILIPSVISIAVIGGGIAGMRAAIELNDMWCKVTVIEREHFYRRQIVSMGCTMYYKSNRKTTRY